MKRYRKLHIVPIFAVLFILLQAICPNARAQERESLSYLFAGNTATYTYNVDRTGGSLSVVCPDYFEVEWDGTLKLTRPVDPLFVESMHQRGVRVTPFLSNHWDRTRGRLALDMKHSLAASLRDMVAEYNLDGVDIDIENLTYEDRHNFTDFVRVVREALPADKTVTVAVPANPWGVEDKGWQGSCDYAALGEYADNIFIMAYDESYESGPAGAVASLKFAEDSVKYALKKLPPEKIMLGVPFYGRYWMSGKSYGGYGVAISSIEKLVEKYPSNTWYDAAKDCARATVTVDSVDAAFQIWGGRQLQKGVYDIWYENEESLEKKLALVKKYNILGAGSWALGQEPVRFWGDYRTWLMGLPFGDIGRHWAQQYIVSLYEKSIVRGSDSGRYNPDMPMTRAETAALIVRISGLGGVSPGESFKDTAGHWAENDIAIVRKFDLMRGNDEGYFSPDRHITREEFAVLADRYLNLPNTVDFTDPLYPDVSMEGNPWSHDAIIKLTQNGVLSGSASGFRPKAQMLRGEAAKVIDFMLALPAKVYITGENMVRQVRRPVIDPR